MKTTPVDTGDLRWAELHIGKVSAGEADSLFKLNFDLRDGETPKTFLYRKAAEAYRGMPMISMSANSASSWQIDQGILLEEYAIPWYELEYEEKVTRGLFCETDDGLAGCTPDGLIGEDGGLEIKSPEPHTHCKYLIEGKLPSDYVQQVHFSLYVTGRKWWRFISFRRKFPALVLTIERDEAIMEKIDTGVKTFQKQLSSAVDKLKSLKL